MVPSDLTSERKIFWGAYSGRENWRCWDKIGVIRKMTSFNIIVSGGEGLVVQAWCVGVFSFYLNSR